MGALVQPLIELLSGIPLWIRIAAAPVGFTGTLYLAFSRYHSWVTSKKKRKLIEDEYASKFLSQFNDDEIKSALSRYVVPTCSTSNPTDRQDEEYLADLRQSLFEYMDENLLHRKRSYNLLLADTGMGKTMFCLNYFAHRKKVDPDLNVCLVSLASKQAGNSISSVVNKADTLLIADALDEDPLAAGRGRQRLEEILELAADF